VNPLCSAPTCHLIAYARISKRTREEPATFASHLDSAATSEARCCAAEVDHALRQRLIFAMSMHEAGTSAGWSQMVRIGARREQQTNTDGMTASSCAVERWPTSIVNSLHATMQKHRNDIGMPCLSGEHQRCGTARCFAATHRSVHIAAGLHEQHTHIIHAAFCTGIA